MYVRMLKIQFCFSKEHHLGRERKYPLLELYLGYPR